MLLKFKVMRDYYGETAKKSLLFSYFVVYCKYIDVFISKIFYTSEQGREGEKDHGELQFQVGV
jgi:hypothetical protein